ncbi:MAG TPA: V-type ATP synthase subunit I [Candidatus Limiplasma sp.]|nr:V-type ATP synthase subunit I [Candidatus Limiplasma sp.]
MAIVEMKHVDMLALQRDKHALLRALQKLHSFQITPQETGENTFSPAQAEKELPSLEDTLTRIEWAISKLHRYDKTKQPFLSDKPAIDEHEAEETLQKLPSMMSTIQMLEGFERKAGDLRGQSARIDAAREQLLPWTNLDVPLHTVHDTKTTVQMIGTVPKEALDKWLAEENPGDLCYLQEVSQQRDLACVYLIFHKSCKDAALSRLKELGFAQINLRDVYVTAAERIAALDKEQADVETQRAQTNKQIEALADQMDTLRKLYDLLASRRDRLLAAKQMTESEKTFFLQGWIPAPMAQKAEAALRKVSPTVALEFYDPLEGEEPPVLLHNPKITAPFESIVSGFALPKSGSFDPTTIMMPFFVNFMGMMISDAGYGLMMALIIPILIIARKPAPGTKRLMWILMAAGIASLFWGAMYNSWFGFNPFPSVFDPVKNAMPVMVVCIGLGAVHLFAGLFVAAYVNIREKKYLDAVYDQLSWALIIVGAGLLLILGTKIGQWMALAGVALVIYSAGRHKSKNPFKRLISGLGALYGITGWISDLLSYMRLFGMGLATGVIGMVINILIGMVMQSGIVGIILGSALFVGGHLFNAAINTLGAYVHSCRLQYIEFFSKFYEDGGKPFMPLSETSRYVYVRDTQES